jgi:membrane protease YdiL (CAAX protease family)
MSIHGGHHRRGLHGHFARRPLTWFFALSFLLSWVAWLPYVLSDDGLGILHFGFTPILGTTQLLGVLPGAYLGPILSAFLVTAAADGRPGLRRWTGRLNRWKVSWRWYLAVLVSVPVLLTVTTVAVSDQNPVLPTVAVLVAYLPGLLLQMVTTGIAEEPGWRDFALPRLQRRFGPVVGTLILGPLWGAWHLPLFLTQWGDWPHVTLATPVEFIGTCMAFSFVMTWVFNRTGESLPLAMLLHSSVNTFFSFAWCQMFPHLDPTATTQAFLLASTAVALILLVVTRGRLGYRPSAEPVAAAEQTLPIVKGRF